ncbi:hypothetical protein RND81_12G071700 [Saponaria officinalis]|uniref:Peptidase A1 domain-containing protein n=1 Tax=Saponaria officinalis TaxID=3572 RepID=A0AAW1H7L9_SAPOF
MESINFLSLLFSIFFFIQSHLSLSSPIFLPLSIDPLTHQHLTLLFHTPQLSPINLVFDLNSPFLSLGVSGCSLNESFIPHRSIQCSAARSDPSGPLDERCTVSVKNPVTGKTVVGELVHGLVAVNNRISAVDGFVYVSAPSVLLAGLSNSARGVLGLGRNRIGVAEQVTHQFGLSKKFSVCLSSSNNGVVLFGENHLIEVSNSMVYTPILMGNDNSYQINFKSLKVQDKKLPLLLHQSSSIKISTISPYTLTKPEIYKELIKAFSTEAEKTGMNRVNPIGQFELCYEAKEFKKVPVIDLVLQSEMVKWRIYGQNSMVKVNDKVMCLGILDGGEELEASIVMGSHQMEDNLVEFDLGRSMIGFSSLGMKKTSCSQLSSLVHNDVQSL